jgi:glyoxylase-like metal-dependent hydrolase (beta-lactamase superfamily II)
MKKILKIGGLVLAILIVAGGVLTWVGYHNFMAIEVVHYDPQLKIVLGGGGNSIVLSSIDGARALVVDTKMGNAAKKLKAEVAAGEITIVNTHAHADHASGNILYPTAHVIAGAYTKEQWADAAGKNRYPDETVPMGREKILRFDSETVHLRNMGAAHTTNDVVVYLEKRKLLVTGDIVFASRHPVLFAQSGCNVGAWIRALDTLYNGFEVAVLVPGHGPVGDQKAIAGMKEYFVSIRDAIGNREKLDELKRKYANYASLPALASFDKTVAFIANELKK